MAKLFAPDPHASSARLRSHSLSRRRRRSRAQAPVNPTASAVKEQQLLNELSRIQGRGTIPDAKSYVLEHPVGRDWRQWHEVTLRWIGAIAVLGMLALLVIFYLSRGMVKIEGGRSGRKIVRFNAVRALRPLADRDLLHHPGDLRPQHHLRQAAAAAAARARGLHHLVGAGEVRAQLSSASPSPSASC